MRVAFDTSVALFDPGGTRRYTRELLDRGQRFEGIELRELNMATGWPWTQRLGRRGMILLHDLGWVRFGMRRAAAAMSADLLHGAAFRVARGREIATSVTIHDDTIWDPDLATRWQRMVVAPGLEWALPGIRGALTSCETTARAIAIRVPGLAAKLRVTRLGVNHDIFQPASDSQVTSLLGRLHVERPYVLIVGPHGKRKNYAAMLSALSMLRQSHPDLSVVVVGRAAPGRHPLPIHIAGELTEPELAVLYSGAAFLFYASLREGFGLPVLEGMACGCPVLTSQGGALEEVSGGAAILVNPRDVAAMADAGTRLLEDRELTQKLVDAGRENAGQYSWDDTVGATAAAWRDMGA